MAFITDKLGNKIYIPKPKHKTKMTGRGTNINNLPLSAAVNGKVVKDIYYTVWTGMLGRAIITGDTVCDEWYEFSNFYNWMNKYDFVGKELNHTLLIPGNTVYNKDTCIFVPTSISKIISYHSDNELPTGVSPNRSKYMSRISINGKQTNLGTFSTVEEASNVYTLAKIKELEKVVVAYDGDRKIKLQKGLKQHIKLLKNQLT